MRLPSRLVSAALMSLLVTGVATRVVAAEPDEGEAVDEAGADAGATDEAGEPDASSPDEADEADAGVTGEEDAGAGDEADAGAAAAADTTAADTVDEAAIARARCRPTDIIFLIDNSASFTGARAQVRAYAEGAREFLETLGEQHRVSMIKFGEKADVMVEPSFNTAENRDTVVNAIEDLSMREPWTNVYAGVDLAFRKIRVDEDRRGVILMISDGVISMPGPNGRESDEVKEQQKQWIASRLPDAREQKAAFYTVAYENKFTDYELMQKIADETGGFSAKGDNASLADTMRKVAKEMCARDPLPVRRKAVPVVAAPPAAPPPAPAPVTLTPPAPVPVGAPLGLIVGLAGAGVAVLGTGTFLMMRSRRRRAAMAGAGGAAHEDVFSSGELAAGVAAGGAAAAVAGGSRRDRSSGSSSGGGGGDRYFTRSSTITMEAVPDPEYKKKKPRPGGGGEERGGRPSSSSPSPSQGSGRSAPGSAAPPSVAIDRGREPDRRGPPGKPPGWGEEHMMRIIGFTTGGKEIKEIDFRRNGDVVVAVGTSGGAVISVPPEKGNVRGTVVYNVMPDGTRIVRIKEIPPGGFRDRDTGVALREGDVLSNNQKIEWVKEERGRYFEIFYK